MAERDTKLLRVGELAKAAGKTVRAMHLYEELGLVQPAMRTDGGFRLYHPDAVARIGWIVKLQAIGFTLSEIQGFVREFEEAASGREATARVREVFSTKLREIREQITQLEVIENDVTEALEYLDACQSCSPAYAPTECVECGHQGHERGSAPPLFANLSRSAGPPDGSGAGAGPYDVAVGELTDGAKKSDPRDAADAVTDRDAARPDDATAPAGAQGAN